MDVFTLKLKQLFRTVHNKKKMSKDETETELSESKTIIEEKDRCIKEILSVKLHMENLLDKMVGRLKEIHEYQHLLLFLTDNLIFLYVLHRRRRKYILTHPERDIKAILKASDKNELFKWTEECRKGMPIDYNFILPKGTLSNFKGSKGPVGELSVVNSDSEDYDVIRFKAEPIPNSRPDDDGTDEVYRHARWFKLAELKYRFLVYLTLTTIKTLNFVIGFELGIWDQNEENASCLKMLKFLCRINENPPDPIRLNYEERAIARHEELTIPEYRTAVRLLGCNHFKSTLDSWSKYSFNVMRMAFDAAKAYDEWHIQYLLNWGIWYYKYLHIIKRGRVSKKGVHTFGAIICRTSKTINRTVYENMVKDFIRRKYPDSNIFFLF